MLRPALRADSRFGYHFDGDSLKGDTKMETKLVEGSQAPDFRLPSTTGGSVGPGDYAGKKRILIAFYPKDNTSG